SRAPLRGADRAATGPVLPARVHSRRLGAGDRRRSRRCPVDRERSPLMRTLLRRLDAGMNTAEYAVGTLAAVAFAGILLRVVTSDPVQAALQSVIDRALG